VWEGEYLPFGEPLTVTGSVTNNLRFPGQYFDSETELHYNYYRDYKPVIGRYVEADPILQQLRFSKRGGNRCSTFHTPSFIIVHPYIYVTNNPVKMIDPKGLKECATFGNIAAPNSCTIVCDGAGSIMVQTNCYGNKNKCYKKCAERHENVHKNDCLKYSSNVCEGKARGMQVWMSKDISDSECRAYKATVRCLKSSKKTKKCCNTIKDEDINFFREQVKKYCRE
jgi:RHS repeat-associated protein